MEANLEGFRAANTQVLGVSIDSVYSHANWGSDMGGVSFPLLADFEPKGQVARSFGHYLSDAGITDRATVIIDKAGVVRYSESVTPGGERNIEELLAECKKINEDQPAGEMLSGRSAPGGSVLYVKTACGHSRKASLALQNLHLGEAVMVKNVSEDAAAAAELKQQGGKDQAPCLWFDGEAIYEADAIVKALVERMAPVPCN